MRSPTWGWRSHTPEATTAIGKAASWCEATSSSPCFCVEHHIFISYDLKVHKTVDICIALPVWLHSPQTSQPVCNKQSSFPEDAGRWTQIFPLTAQPVLTIDDPSCQIFPAAVSQSYWQSDWQGWWQLSGAPASASLSVRRENTSENKDLISAAK